MQTESSYKQSTTFDLTDLGNAKRLISLRGERLRFCPERRKWLIPADGRWQWDELGGIMMIVKDTVRSLHNEADACANEDQRQAIIKHQLRSEALERIQTMVRLAAALPNVAVSLSELDADPWLLNCVNGTLDLRTGDLRPHDPADLITKSTGLPFRADARSELWNRVIQDITGGQADLAETLQRFAGYSLIGLPLERASFLLHGPSSTGKSTFVSALVTALGDYAMTSSFDTFCVQSDANGIRGDLARLAGARLVSCPEIRRQSRWDEQLVQRITDGSTLVARAKYEGEVKFTPSFTLIFTASQPPERSGGVWTRMRRIPLSCPIPAERQDRFLRERLEQSEHAEAILAWAVEGCRKYQKDGLGSALAIPPSTLN